MAISATEIFRRHPECYDEEACELFTNGTDPFELPGLHFTRETAESMALNNLQGGAVIMAGSGVCTGGRVRLHIKHKEALINSEFPQHKAVLPYSMAVKPLNMKK